MSRHPEREFDTVPPLSEVSGIVEVSTSEYRKGIILDSPEEVSQALLVYGGSSDRSARATQNNLMDAAFESGVQGFLIRAEVRNIGFVESLAEEALSELQTNGKFRRNFEYDAAGTNFFKTGVRGWQEGDKYVLELNAAYAGSEPEKELAETLGKSMALVKANANGILTVVDDWWFNADLEEILKGIAIKGTLAGLAEYITYDSSVKPEIRFDHDGQEFLLDIDLKTDRYLRPENQGRGSEYLQTRGNTIVGGAWTTRAENGMEKCEPRVIQPEVVLSVSLPGKRYARLAVTPGQMKSVEEARDYIAETLK